MAQRILKKYPRSIYKGTNKVKQPFNYLLVIDFEATCKELEKLEPQEIIEFPCAAVSTKTWKIENTFHEYIKPRVHPNLTPFCTQLTGIIQEMVDNQPQFPEVLEKFCGWLDEHSYFKDGNDSAFVTCGDWDLKMMLPSQCNLENVPLPAYFEKWINLKLAFCDATQHYPRSLRNMLLHLKLPVLGQLHSGIDDVKNMVKVIEALVEHDALFKINSTSKPLGELLARPRLKF